MKPLVPRSLLFVPASRPDFIAKAASSGADAVILDLEDGVAAAARDGARRALPELASALKAKEIDTWVRVRRLLDGGAEDLVAAVASGGKTILLPKVDGPSAVGELASLLDTLEAPSGTPAPSISIVPLIETAVGLLEAPAIARANPRVAGLAFGSEDLAADLMVAPTALALAGPAQGVAIAARAAGLPAFGLPGSLAEFRDLAAFAAIVDHAAAIGFSGALAIHPAQIPVINAGFAPSAADREWARKIVAAAEAGADGSFAIEGRMIDRPVIERARRILDRASVDD